MRPTSLGLSGLSRRHDQGDAVGAQPGYGSPIHCPHSADVDRQSGDLCVGPGDRRAALVDVVIEQTHSCFLGERSQRHVGDMVVGTVRRVSCERTGLLSGRRPRQRNAQSTRGPTTLREPSLYEPAVRTMRARDGVIASRRASAARRGRAGPSRRLVARLTMRAASRLALPRRYGSPPLACAARRDRRCRLPISWRG